MTTFVPVRPGFPSRRRHSQTSSLHSDFALKAEFISPNFGKHVGARLPTDARQLLVVMAVGLDDAETAPRKSGAPDHGETLVATFAVAAVIIVEKAGRFAP